VPLSEFMRKLVETKLTGYCLNRVPEHLRDKVKIIFKIRGNNVTLFETRPFHQDPSKWTEKPIAQLRFEERSSQWYLYYPYRNSRWRPYAAVIPRVNLELMLRGIDRDPSGRFRG
jgi:hypothetical protein